MQRTAHTTAEAAAPQQAVIEIRLELDAFHARFNQAVAEVMTKALTAALKEKAAEIRAAAREQFATQGRSGGTPWPARRNRTLSTIHRPLLQRSGLLLASLTEEFNPAHVERLDVDERGIPYLVFGTAVRYSRFHQEGTRTIPQRQLLTPQMLGGTARAQFPV
ncbi:MAG: phage virion morphogenesis protein [Acidobacteria bacterium]|nr:phage virion morphogenesis protein [Acidobacteriota bacterium]